MYDVNQNRVVGASLYDFDEAKADMLHIPTNLYPSDHSLISFTPSADGHTCAIHMRDGGYAAMQRVSKWNLEFMQG